MTQSVWTIVVGAGSGTRFGGPKQLADCAGRRVIDWSTAAALTASDGVVLVLPPALISDDGHFETDSGVVTAVPGGETRSGSVRAGLAAVPADAAVIVVHDAARPAASPALFARAVAAVRSGAHSAIPVVPVVDTIRHIDGGVVDRETLVAVQTPQAFAASSLRAAHAGTAEATDDASLVEAAGGLVVHVEGEPANMKITTPADLSAVAATLSREVPS